MFASIQKFNKLFDIDPNLYDQDWEIEAADPAKLELYLNAYHTDANTDDDRFTLMALVLDAFEEHHHPDDPIWPYWDRIKVLLERDIAIHRDHIEYYQSYDEDNGESMFPITQAMRQIKLQTGPA